MSTVFIIDDDPGDGNVRIYPGTLWVGGTVYPVLAQAVAGDALQRELSTMLHEHTAANAPHLVISLLTADMLLAGTVLSAVSGQCSRATALVEGGLRELDPRCLSTPALFHETVGKVRASAVVSYFSVEDQFTLLFYPTTTFFAAVCGADVISQQDERAFVCALEYYAVGADCVVYVLTAVKKSYIDTAFMDTHMLAIHYCSALQTALGPALAYGQLALGGTERQEAPTERPLKSFQIDNEKQLNELHDALQKRTITYNFEQDTRRELDLLREFVAEATTRRKALVAELNQKREYEQKPSKANDWNADLYAKKRYLQMERDFLGQLERMLAAVEK